MKHLVGKEHHPHLKKRAVLEVVGLIALVLLSLDQRELIYTALQTLRQSDIRYVLLMACVYWLLLPLTPLSYRILLNKPLPLKTTILAQMAGAGPGRVIPGNLGHISIAAAHITKSGNKLRTAVAMTVINNMLGLLTNVVLLLVIVAMQPSLLTTITEAISPLSIIFITAGLLTALTLIQWLAHAHSTRKTIRSIDKELLRLTRYILRHYYKLCCVVAIAIVITIGHVALLTLSGTAIGIAITPYDALVALSIGILLGGVVPTPGGFGAVEAGTTTALILLGYSSNDAVTTALLFRAITYWMPLIPGLFAYLYLRERKLL